MDVIMLLIRGTKPETNYLSNEAVLLVPLGHFYGYLSTVDSRRTSLSRLMRGELFSFSGVRNAVKVTGVATRRGRGPWRDGSGG